MHLNVKSGQRNAKRFSVKITAENNVERSRERPETYNDQLSWCRSAGYLVRCYDCLDV